MKKRCAITAIKGIKKEILWRDQKLKALKNWSLNPLRNEKIFTWEVFYKEGPKLLRQVNKLRLIMRQMIKDNGLDDYYNTRTGGNKLPNDNKYSEIRRKAAKIKWSKINLEERRFQAMKGMDAMRALKHCG